MDGGSGAGLVATVKSIRRGEMLSLVELEVSVPARLEDGIPIESIDDLKLQAGDTVQVVIKSVQAFR